MESEKIKFSILIPAYKSAFLEDAILSVIRQSYSNWELVIVDDNSPEDLFSIVKQYSDPRIMYFKNEVNCGAINVVDNWNICLGYCTGDYVICIGDDDRLRNCCLYEYSILIENYPNLNVYHAWTQIIDNTGNVIEVLEPRPTHESVYSLIYYRWKGRRQYIGDFCYKTQHLRENGGYYKLPLAWGADDITAVRAALNGGIANTSVPCFEYRISELTISKGTKHTKVKLESTLQEQTWYENLFNFIDYTTLSAVDSWYVDRIKTYKHIFYRRRITEEIVNDTRSNLLRFFYWLFNLRPYTIRKSYYFKKLLECFYYKVERN